MSEQPSWTVGDDPTDEESDSIALLARAALASPSPTPEAERESRERTLAQFQEAGLPPRPLHETPIVPGQSQGWTQRLGRALRRLLGR